MRLDSLLIQKFRLFDSLAIDFHPELTVIVAPNGGGKTAVLDAIKIAFGPYLGAFATGISSGIEHEDIRRVRTSPELGRMADALPAVISATGRIDSGKTETWCRERVSRKGKTTIKHAKSLIDYAKALQFRELENQSPEHWPLLAYYGTGRLWNQLKLTERKLFKSGFHARAAGYQDCMKPASSYKFFLEWFTYATRSDFQEKLRSLEQGKTTNSKATWVSGPFAILLEAVNQAVGTVLAPTGWGALRFSAKDESVVVEHPEYGELFVDQMSDGIRNTLAMVADISWRCVQLNAHLGEAAVEETGGVVLIDEVDMHLHPEWQQIIVGSLREAFPKIQFIVTTHSPQVLTSVRRESIRMLKIADGRTVVEIPAHETYGQESRSALEDVFDVSSRPPLGINRNLQDYLKLVEGGDEATDMAMTLRENLDRYLGPGDPQLQLADMLISRNQAIRQGRKG